MNRSFGVCAALKLVCCVGCDPRVKYQWYNNTGAPVSIVRHSGDLQTIDPGKIQTIYRYEATEPVYEVHMAGERLCYRLTLPSGREYYGYDRDDNTWVWRLQVDPDGSIVAVRATEAMPVDKANGQPSRFPLMPIQRSKLQNAYGTVPGRGM